MMKMVEMIGKREGIGDLLAEGSARAAAKIGKGAEQYAMVIKNQELPMHDPRGKVGLGIGYAVSPTGADHMHNMHDPEFARVNPTMAALGILEPLPADDLSADKVRMFRYLVSWQHFKNCASWCMFIPYDPNAMSEMVNAATGWHTSAYELMKVGERAVALSRLFNAREGMTAKDDRLPDRLHTGVSTGPVAGKGIDRKTFQAALDNYYAICGLDPVTGGPTEGTLLELDMGWAVPQLKA
jgi:aldehyde:ferredoxin oxidoreductase